MSKGKHKPKEEEYNTVQDLVKSYIVTDRKLSEFIDKKKVLTQALLKVFNEQDRKQFELRTSSKVFYLKKVQKMTINYDVVKLKEKLDKELYNEIVDKKYVVMDIEGLKKLCKSHGIKPAQLMKVINVEDTVNKPRLKNLYEVGDINLKDIKGCFDYKTSEYFSIK